MNSPLHVFRASSLATVFAVAGCSAHQSAKPQAAGATQQPITSSADATRNHQVERSIDPSSPAQTIEQDDPSTANLLTRKTESYTRSIAPLLQQRGVDQPPARSQPQPQKATESAVEWIKPGEATGTGTTSTGTARTAAS